MGVPVPLFTTRALVGFAALMLACTVGQPASAAPRPTPDSASADAHARAGSTRAPAAAREPTEVAVEAHRGGPALGAPGGSAKLFRLAVAAGVERVEVDVFFTKDKVAVVNHSDTIEDAKAFTTVGGIKVAERNCTHDGSMIRKLTYAQVQRVRCGGQPLPTLTEVMAIVKNSGTTMNLEVKAWSADQSAASKRDVARRAVTQAVSAGMTDQMVVSTFSWREMASTVKAVSTDLRLIGYLPVKKVRQPTSAMYQQARDAKALGVDALGFDVDYASVTYLDFIRGLGMGLHLYDLGSTAKIRFAVAGGQQYVGSDDPVATRKVLAELTAKPPTPTVSRTQLRPKTVLDKRLAKGARSYPRIIGASGVVPTAAQTRLQSVRVRVTIKAAASGGHLELAPSNSRLDRDGVSIAITKGTTTRTVEVSPGDYGRLRVRATAATVRVTVTVVGHANVT